jgi:hypothetical protein
MTDMTAEDSATSPDPRSTTTPYSGPHASPTTSPNASPTTARMARRERWVGKASSQFPP